MVERPTTLITQSLLILVTLMIGVFIGGIIGYLLGQSRATAVSVVVTATASVYEGVPPFTPTRIPVSTVSTGTSPASEANPTTTMPTALLRMTEPPLTTSTLPATEQSGAPAPITTTAVVHTTLNTEGSSIPLPEVVTLTPTPKVLTQIDINEAQANEMAARVVTATPEFGFLSSPTLKFLDGMLELRATSNDPTGQFGSGDLIVRGRPEIRGVRVVFKIDSAQIAGQPVPVDFYPKIEAIIGGVFREMIGERPADAVKVGTGVLRVTVIELS